MQNARNGWLVRYAWSKRQFRVLYMRQIFVVLSFIWVGYEFHLNSMLERSTCCTHWFYLMFFVFSHMQRDILSLRDNSNAWAKTLADAAGEWRTQCKWYWGRCKHILTFVSSMSTASQQHNGGKRVCRRDIDYASLLETGKTTAGPVTTASFVRHLSAVADITLSKFVWGNAPPIHHVTMPVGGVRVSDLRPEKHRLTWHWMCWPKDCIWLLKNASKIIVLPSEIYWQMQARAV